LKVTEAPDNSIRRFAGPKFKARCALRKTGPLWFKKSGTGQRQPPGFSNSDCFHKKKVTEKRDQLELVLDFNGCRAFSYVEHSVDSVLFSIKMLQ
jgi:hypothetical protein